MATQLKCPSCSTILRVPDGLQAGSAIRCPKCATVLRVPAQAAASVSGVKPPPPVKPDAPRVQATPPAAPTAPPGRQAAPPRPAPQAIKPAAAKAPPAVLPADDLIEDDADDIPSRPAPKKKSNKGLLFGILGCAGLLFLTCGGLVTYGVYRVYSAGKEVAQKIDQQIKQEMSEQATLNKDGPGKNPIDKNPLNKGPRDQTPPVQALPAGNTLDVSFIAADFNAAVVIHPARILRSKSPLLPAADMQDMMLGEIVKETGIDPRQIEQAVFLVDPFPGGNPPAGPTDPKGDPVAGRAFTSAAGRFSVQFPGNPKRTIQKDPKGGITHTYLLELAGGKVVYMVMYNDLPAGAMAAGGQFLLDTIAKQFGDSVKRKKNIKLDGNMGMELELERNERGTTVLVTDRIYLVGQRMYQVMATAAKDSKDPAQFAKFLDSFQLRKLGDPLPPRPPSTAPPAQAPPAGSGSNVLLFPAGILHFAEPVDGQKVLRGMLKQTEPAGWAGKIYLRSKTEEMARVPLAGFVANERTILLAPEPTLKKMLAARNVNSPLIDRLRQVNLDNDATGVFVVGPFRPALAELSKQPNIPPQLSGLKSLDRNLEAVTFTVNANSDKLLEIVLHGTNEPAADSLEQLARAALDMGKQMYGGMKHDLQKDAPKDLPPDLTAKLFRVSDQIESGGIKVTRKGKEIIVTLEKPKDL